MKILLAIVLVGCGAPGAVPADPAGPACTAVADHLLELAERDNAARAGAPLATGIRAEALRQCDDTPWSAARRTCLLDASTQDDTLTCASP